MPPPSLSSWLPHTLSLLLSLMWSKAFPSDEHSCYRWHMPRAIHHLLIGTSVKDFLRAQCVAAAPIFIFPKGGRKYLKYFLSILGTLWVADISSYRRVQPSPYINWKKFCMWLHTSWAQRWFCSSQCFLLVPHILQETSRTSSLIKAVFSYSTILSEDPVTYLHVSLLFHRSGICK